MSLTRRDLLGLSAGIIGSTALGSGIARAGGWSALNDRPIAKGKKPKNIIFCVVDGMPLSCLTVVDHLRQFREGKSSYWAWLMDQPFTVNGLQDTRSLSSVVTDSSAAASAWGSGTRIWNGMTNMLPDKTELMTLTKLMHAKGVRCGLVTTATMTHATPSGFAVSCVQRDYEGVIAERYLDSGVDVLLGGGDRFFSASRRPDKRDLYADFAKAGFQVAKTRTELMGAKKEGKMLGIFANSHLPYTVDRDNDPKVAAAVPTLTEMTNYALDNLKGSRNGFLLQVEGARVDHGGHSNDLAAMIFDQIEFENAVKACIDFAMEDGETLVIITADHACGGLALNGAGDEYFDSTQGMKSISMLKSSYGPLLAATGAGASAEKITEVVKDKLMITLTSDEAGMIASSMGGKHPFGGSIFYRSTNGTLGLVLGNHLKCTFTSSNHSSDHVMVTAYGPGSELCNGITWNTDFFDIMTGLKGIKYENPTMSFADAVVHYEKLMEELKTPKFLEISELYGAHEECGCHGA